MSDVRDIASEAYTSRMEHDYSMEYTDGRHHSQTLAYYPWMDHGYGMNHYYAQNTLKRTYPFGEEEQVPLEESLLGLSPVPANEPLCLLGSVVNVNAQLRRQTSGHLAPQTILGGLGPNDLLTVSLVGDYFELSHANYAFARLDKSFCGEARRLVDLGVTFQARVDLAQWETIRKEWACFSGQAISNTFAVDVSVYSRRNHADRVGDILLRSNLFLQHPAHHFDIEYYYNPQILELEGFEENPDDVATEPMEDEVSTGVEDTYIRSDEQPSGASTDHVELILDSLSHKNILHEIRTDTNLIKSELMKHQMTALDFVVQRESDRPPEQLTFWRGRRVAGETEFIHILTRMKAPKPHEARGGIIADDMGLGKSLTILSAIARSLGEAAEFASSHQASSTEPLHTQNRSRATLIMVPSTVLIDNWIDEIRMHTHPHKISFHKHLGGDRQSEAKLLGERDIVFTTFATAWKDFKKGSSPLARVHWFRIVLDEAHKIRNRTTQQFKAVHELRAQRRWCLTGTPIQNRLEDLGSLIAFLRVPDMENAPVFRKHIIAPTSLERGSQFQNLRILLRTVCLRRTREVLALPEPIVQQRLLDFSTQERYRYDELYEHYKKYIQMAVSGVRGKVVSTTLQSIHELRLFCNNGPKKMQNELQASEEEVLSYLQQLGQNECSNCTQSINCIDKFGEQEGGVLISPCKHLVCRSCLPQCLDKRKNCRLCASGKSPLEFATHIGADAPVLAVEEIPDEYPSKLLALLEDIQKEPLHKCIVFSSWKKTLDLASGLLQRAGLKHSIIHGSLSLKQRLKVLKEYKSFFGPNILLMTLGTGAEGLNLTIASRIYLLEPQWNPFTEMQAMARAQRIGQTKQVVCKRYLMKDSIEQSDVLNRQNMKRALAGGGFQKNKMHDSLQYFGVHSAHIQGC
ncbi:hypothetical protein BU24DRAFT_263670 [Aaosphaeria arxii CBS 175.79]|uniref:Uncharacterized protein n=1 Tax=Aaosphaeria arxii CBS 175.79 TaxID=1450172 RepID=A0A6A5XIH4_9PLEO|nr:uncharacterized protein BU24DRAFT_263670 [Aaosphaeria arxii CBS 175.79]KAF2013075.1 hypothetical protein BU24DRAFT_263670 [Aaosphaeria arxii CBS 175.79]